MPSANGASRSTEWSYAQDDVNAPRLARAVVAADASIPRGVRDDAVIVVSELVANAVRHAMRVPDGRIGVSLRRDPDGLRIEVRDPGTGFTATPGAPREGGIGLVVVDRIASAWGIRGGTSTIVWCVIPIAPSVETAGAGSDA